MAKQDGVRFPEVFAFRLPEPLIARLEAAAREQFETPSSLSRRLLREGLERLEAAKAARESVAS